MATTPKPKAPCKPCQALRARLPRVLARRLEALEQRQAPKPERPSREDTQ